MSEDRLPPACEWGPSSWCKAGKHERCEHRPDGAQAAGHTTPECYLTIPARAGRGVSKDRREVVSDATGLPMALIEPSHTWRCACSCHETPQKGITA